MELSPKILNIKIPEDLEMYHYAYIFDPFICDKFTYR